MKKYTVSILAGFFAILLTCTFTNNSVNAQNMSVGLKGGLNLSQMFGDINKPAFIMGVNSGLFYTYQLKKNYAFTAELNFTMKGTKYYNLTDFTHQRINYVELPILCQYYIICEKLQGFVPKVFIGPAVGYMIYAKDFGVDAKNNYKKADFGLVAGMGFQKPFLYNTTFIFDVRYQYGLLDIVKASDINANLANLSFNIGLSYPLAAKAKEEKK